MTTSRSEPRADHVDGRVPSASIVEAAAGFAGSPCVDEREADLGVGTLDSQGRLCLLGPAQKLGWHIGRTIVLRVDDGVFRFTSDAHRRENCPGLPLRLDGRSRIQFPYGIRVAQRLEPRSRLLLLTVPAEGTVAALPVWRVLAALSSR